MGQISAVTTISVVSTSSAVTTISAVTTVTTVTAGALHQAHKADDRMGARKVPCMTHG